MYSSAVGVVVGPASTTPPGAIVKPCQHELRIRRFILGWHAETGPVEPVLLNRPNLCAYRTVAAKVVKRIAAPTHHRFAFIVTPFFPTSSPDSTYLNRHWTGAIPARL